MAAAEDASLDTMSAREIKERLAAARVDFSDCFEKSELVKRLRQHREAEAAERVQEVKALANSAFSRGGYALAIRFYTEALDLCAHDDVAAQLQVTSIVSPVIDSLVGAVLVTILVLVLRRATAQYRFSS